MLKAIICDFTRLAFYCFLTSSPLSSILPFLLSFTIFTLPPFLPFKPFPYLCPRKKSLHHEQTQVQTYSS